MKNNICLLLFILLSINAVFSQNFIGKITDQDNNAIIGATVFIKEKALGLSCNDDGKFQTTLPQGIYTVEFRCLGYESIQNMITIKDEVKVINIVLKKKTFILDEIIIFNKEDPAYEIMRKAIKQAPFHLQKVRAYTAEAYIKGNMELRRVSKLVDKLSSENGLKMSDYKEKLFVQESFSEIIFSYPDKYTQTVKAFSSTIPDNFDPKESMPLMRNSLYSATTSGGKISPLNPNAFNYYRFKYEGFSEENNSVINKIKVIPKLNDPQLMDGYIYIADNTWDLRYAELMANVYGVKQEFTVTYGEISNDVFLPISYTNLITANVMGVEGFFNYFSSLKYSNVDIAKNDIDESQPLKRRKPLQIDKDTLYTIKTDTLATKRDSIYWSTIRNIPLNKNEINSYLQRDSVQSRIDSLRRNYTNSKFKPSSLILGGKIGGDSTLVTFKYNGLLFAPSEYNFVDGFWIGQKFDITMKLDSVRSLKLSPQIHYATARKTIIWKGDLTLDYSPIHMGRLYLSLGSVSEDYNPMGINRFDNSLSTLFVGENFAMLYKNNFGKIGNDIELIHGLRLSTSLQIAKRNGLNNNTHFSLWGNKNRINPNLNILDNFDLAAYNIGMAYTPRMHYSIKNGSKNYEYSKYPTLKIYYSEGFSSWLENNSKFRKIEGSISHNITTDYFSNLNYTIDGGSFLGNKSKVNFADFQHFNTSDIMLMSKNSANTFVLLDNYIASTNKYWLQAHTNYTSKYILIKRLPFLQGKLFDEFIQIKYLYTPQIKHHMEIGYGIYFLSLLNIGVYNSFDTFKYDKFGFRLSYNLKKLIN